MESIKKDKQKADCFYVKKMFFALAMISFAFFSAVIICSKDESRASNYRSSQLSQKITESGQSKRIDFINKEGRITQADDLGYSTIVITYTEEGTLEQYYDDAGSPVSIYPGYYALLRCYNEKGFITSITYLDSECKPIVLSQGYTIEKREANKQGYICSVRYYDMDGKPISSVSYGFGRNYYYDENGNNTRITYVDATGRPMIVGLGYASILQSFYTDDIHQKRRVKDEFYFDEKGEPIKLSLGQYGVHKEYDDNGMERVLTYIDDRGMPIETNKGYTTIVRTFYSDNTLATECYFDLEGNPYALSEGQYGIKKVNNQIIYLDSSGNELFNLRTLLYNHSWITIILAIGMVAVSIISKKRTNAILIILCLCSIIYMTLMYRYNEAKEHEAIWNFIGIITERNVRINIIRNIWLFVPLGTMLQKIAFKKIVLVIPFLFSLIIETMQYYSNIGIFDVFDIISNSIGGIIGYTIGLMLSRRQKI